MEANSALTLISKDKISHFLGILPLITFILLDIKFILIIIYTIFFAIWEVYILNMESFNKLVTKEITIFDKNNKIKLKNIWPYLEKKFWFIDNMKLMTFGAFVVIIAYFISFVLSIIYIEEKYMKLILLAHTFLLIFMWRLIKIIRNLASDKKVQKAFSKKKQSKNDKQNRIHPR
ncbi:MAG: hypothetical protein BWY36_00449 [Candidatus Diapherotrites archaeon ADurb.Bin253]|jgi:ABC-type multidrug transport system fused ATPase/permease subunit|nr:hypothetical protein [Candidatus Pacearchaeota archaeon]OQA68214.1 MAG: hypothetical protein BWY36_00449 [Candidatus Diapherotrites archaeon ADurb.Bin253]HQB18816.1 hypothetical protein [Candidatus Pacearchaeota archaeon]